MITSQVIDFIRMKKEQVAAQVKKAEAQKTVNEVIRDRTIKKLLKGS